MFQVQPHVDHKRPIHDRLCRCCSCKPAHVDNGGSAGRVWLALAILLALFWLAIGYGIAAR